jgi:hypothetical protein
LLVELPGYARDEAGGQEDADQHQCDRDERARHLVHRLVRGLAGAEALLFDQPLDVLDHDDRVVDDNTDGEHHAEQRQVVERIAEGGEHRERTDQRDRDRDDRNERRPPALQEQEDHECDEDHGLEQRVLDRRDRFSDVFCRIVGNPVFHARWKAPRCRIELAHDGLGSAEGIRAR